MPTQKLETYYLIAFSLLGIFPLVPFIVKPFLLIPLLVIALYNLCFVNRQTVDWSKVIISTSIYFIFLVSTLYTVNIDRAIKLLIRLTPLLVLPFSFAMVPKELYNRLADGFIRIYILSCGVFCFVILAYCISLNSSDIYYIYSYLSNKFWGYEDHPIYLSLYLGLALILMFFKNKKSLLNAFLFITLFFTLLFLSRKGNLIGLVLIALYMLISNSKKVFNKLVLAYSLIGVFIVLGVSYLFNNFLFIRFKEIINLSEHLFNPESSTGIRSILWCISYNLSLESPFLGYGLGSVQDLINFSLIENGYKELTLILKYNAHNQYLQVGLISGYIGLLFFLSILIYIFLKIKNNKRALCVFLYIVFCFIFESLLERQNGIIITSLFLNLFLFLPPKTEIIND